MQQWKNSSHSLHLALNTSMLWNRYRIVFISIVVLGRAIPPLHHNAELVSVDADIDALSDSMTPDPVKRRQR